MSGFTGIQVDDGIVRRAQRGDRKALDIVFRALAPAVYTVCYRLCQSPATADDLTQETFVEVMRHLAGFRFEASLATWVRRIAVSRSLMHLRSAWQRKATAIESLVDEPRAANTNIARRIELGNDIGEALALLTPASRAVVWLYDVEGYSHKEIAELMGKSVSFSKSCLSRAHERLRELLTTDGAGYGENNAPPAPGGDNEGGKDDAFVMAERCLA